MKAEARRALGGARRWWIRRRPRGSGCVLCLHRVVESGRHLSALAGLRDLEITQAQLEQLVGRLRSAGWAFVALAEIVADDADPRSVALTFDDGYLDNLVLAAPVLEELGVPYTLFVTTGFIDRTVEPWWLLLGEMVSRLCSESVAAGSMGDTGNGDGYAGDWRDRLFEAASRRVDPCLRHDRAGLAALLAAEVGHDPACSLDVPNQLWFMTWDQVRELAERPLCTLGCHTVTHRSLGGLSEQEVEHEVAESRRRLAAETGIESPWFAYPHGRDRDIPRNGAAILEGFGLQAGFSTSSRNLRPADRATPWALPRKSVGWNEIRSGVWLDLVAGAFE